MTVTTMRLIEEQFGVGKRTVQTSTYPLHRIAHCAVDSTGAVFPTAVVRVSMRPTDPGVPIPYASRRDAAMLAHAITAAIAALAESSRAGCDDRLHHTVRRGEP